MRRLSYAVPALVLLSTLVLGPPSASALPIASGSNCKSDWVNNPAALACFIQGEEEVRKGAQHPHYVACTAAGEIFCCQDNNNGGQNCEAVRKGGRAHLEGLQLGAILEAQQTILKNLADIKVALNGLNATIAEPSLCSAPDYVP